MANVLYVAQVDYVPAFTPINHLDLIFQSRGVRGQDAFDSLVANEFRRLQRGLTMRELDIQLGEAMEGHMFQYVGLRMTEGDKRPDYSRGSFIAVVSADKLWQDKNGPKLVHDRDSCWPGIRYNQDEIEWVMSSGIHTYRVEGTDRAKRTLTEIMGRFT